ISIILLLFMMVGIGLMVHVFRSSGAISSTDHLIIHQEIDGTPIPDVTLTTLDGQPINLLRDRGEVTILFAMSYWCTTCVPEAQTLARLYEEYHDKGLKIIVIDLDPGTSPEQLQTFIDLVGDNRLIWAFDSDAIFMNHYNVRALDTTIIVNRDGYEVYRDIQVTSYKTLHQALEQLL
ncbi:MAG: TlpA family protein disulfide reductase, partial [Anaerolineae bacterium]|nr:TlpA family protein disulfide reductase [Anaerolineae bacterium]